MEKKETKTNASFLPAASANVEPVFSSTAAYRILVCGRLKLVMGSWGLDFSFNSFAVYNYLTKRQCRTAALFLNEGGSRNATSDGVTCLVSLVGRNSPSLLTSIRRTFLFTCSASSSFRDVFPSLTAIKRTNCVCSTITRTIDENLCPMAGGNKERKEAARRRRIEEGETIMTIRVDIWAARKVKLFCPIWSGRNVITLLSSLGAKWDPTEGLKVNIKKKGISNWLAPTSAILYTNAIL